MHLVCTRCLSLMPEGTHWCQNQKSKCPPGTLSIILDADETFGEAKILSLLRVYPTSALYKATYRGQAVFLKIAHNNYHAYLKAEALLLKSIGDYPSLPHLIAPRSEQPYGKWSVQGELKYFTLFKYEPGSFLDTYLGDRLQLEPRAAAQFLVQLADIAARIALKRRKLILNLRLNSVLVREDAEGILRPTLFDFGALLEIGQCAPDWLSNSHAPSHLAPEVLRGDPCLYQTDVYSLGFILYQILVGEPAIQRDHRTDSELRHLVLTKTPTPLSQRRRELHPAIALAAHKALSKNPAERQSNAHQFGKELRQIVGEVPPERTGIQISPRIWIGVVGAALALMFILALILLLQPQ